MATRTTTYLGAPEPFDPASDDWSLYLQRFEHFLLANEIKDEQKLHLLLALVGAQTFRLLTNLVSPLKPGELTYAEVKEKLSAHFKPKPIKIAERFRFYKRQQEQGENMADYIAELRRLASTCEFGTFLDEALLDKFVCGLRKESIQRRLLAEADLTLKKATELAQGMEAAEKDSKEIKASPSDQSQVHKVLQQQKTQCHRCLGTGHSAALCRFKSLRCNKCKKIGHIARACRTQTTQYSPRQRHQQGNRKRRPQRTHQVEVSGESGESEQHTDEAGDIADIVRVHAVSPSAPKSYKVSLEINNIPITMELDTGASVSLVSEATWADKLNQPQLQPCALSLQSYPNRNLKVLGQCQVKVKVCGKEANLPLIVVEGSGTPLFGRNWLEEIQLNWAEIAKINGITPKSNNQNTPKGLQSLLTKYQEVFQEEMGQCKGVKAHLHVKADATPKFYRPRPIPLSMKEKVEADLERKEKLGILEKIETSDWAAPIVPVSKPDNSVRVCGDYKVTINPHLDVNQYPLPRSEELFAALNGGVHFTKLDLSEAYLQIELDEESKKYLTINTHKGLYQVNRLPYGVASAPAIFQQTMDQILPKLPGVVCFIDDILITGCTEAEHLSNLEAVLQKLQEYGLRLKQRKCKFFQESVEYLGQVVSKEGIHPSSKKIEAILKVQPPTDLAELRSFLGMVNHYGKFIQFLADLSAPLNHLLRKETPWKWSSECQQSFDQIKEALTSTKVLAHYDSKLLVGLACDASAVGVGAVLFHRYEDGTERPIAYASKSLTPAEKNYSQIEREALSIIYGVRKFHQYLYGRNFLLLTDHKPLLTIFGEKKGIPIMAASRLQRWAIILASYSYTIEYVPTKEHGNADCLSRLPIGNDPTFERYQSQNSVVNMVQESQLTSLPISAEEYKQFCEQNGIRHILVAPYHPSANGEAERFVQTFRGSYEKNRAERTSSSSHAVSVTIQNNPSSSKIFGRQIRTRLDLLHPSQKKNFQESKKRQEKGKKQTRELKVGDPVWMRNYCGTEKWIPGVVMSKSGPLSYRILAAQQEHRRHIDQLKKRGGKEKDSDEFDDEFMHISSGQTQIHLEPDTHTRTETGELTLNPATGGTGLQVPDQGAQSGLRRYPLRKNRNPPDRFGQ